MTTWSTMLTEIRSDVLKDSGGKWSDAQLLRWANAGIRQLWPHVFVEVTDATTTTGYTSGTLATYPTLEYSLPSGVPTYPTRCPLRMVEVGPCGGERISDSAVYTQAYEVLKRLPGCPTPRWWVDWSRRKLVIREPFTWYDTGGTYRWYIRLSYVRPPTALTGSSSTLEAPDEALDAIYEWVRYRAMVNIMRSALSDTDRLDGVGSITKNAQDNFLTMVRGAGFHRPWPPLVR